MFERVAVAALTVTPVALIAHFFLRGRTRSPVAGAQAPCWPALLTLAGAAACAVTALTPLLSGKSMRGWWMFAHVAAAPLLMAGLIAVAVQRSPRKTCGTALVGTSPLDKVGDRRTAPGLLAWATPAIGAVAVGSILLNMPPWFGQEGMSFLLNVHRYAGLTLGISAMLHVYCAWIARR